MVEIPCGWGERYHVDGGKDTMCICGHVRMADTLVCQVTNLTPLELTELKPFLVKAMGILQSLEPRMEEDGDEGGEGDAGGLSFSQESV